MDWFAAQYVSRSPEERIQWVNKFSKPPQTPQEEEERRLLRTAYHEIAHASPESLHPVMRPFQGFVQRMLPKLESPTPGAVYAEVEERRHIRQLEAIEEVLQPHPALKALQDRMDTLLGSSNEPTTFNLPAFLDALAKHLKRKEPFLLIECFVPKKADQVAQLRNLRESKPAVHGQLLHLIIQASLMQGAPHPQGCTCPLCEHLASLMQSAPAQSTRASSSASASN